jgi:hypothetical protein
LHVAVSLQHGREQEQATDDVPPSLELFEGFTNYADIVKEVLVFF